VRGFKLLASTVISSLSRLGAFLLILLPVLALSPAAFAQGRGDFVGYVQGVSDSTDLFPDIINYISFLMGATLVALGISDFRRHVENPGNTPMRHALTKLFAGGLFLTLPYAAGVLQGTMDSYDPFYFVRMNAYKYGSLNINSAGLSGMIARLIDNAGVMVEAAAFVAFIIGTFFTVTGIQKVRAHIDNPGNAPLPDGLKRLAVGGVLFSLPMIVNVVFMTFMSEADPIANTGFAGGTGNAGGLDGMMVRFIQDISNPAYYAIEIFCYIAGVLMILFAMQRLVRSAQDGARGPLGFGTIMMFFVAGAFLSFPQVLGMLNTSIFGGGPARTVVSFMSNTGVDAEQLANAQRVFSAVLAFMAVIGFLSVVRGLFMLKSFAEGGQNASMMSIMTHIVAGSIAINLGSFINAVQTSLGVTDFPVTFK
jgi:hypothetical protein